MLVTYMDAYRVLDIQDPLLGILHGRVRLPSQGLRVPFADFGYPPALIPFWSKGTPMYDGLWRHWFGARTASYVTFSCDFGFFAWEIGRNPEQLLTDIVCEYLGHAPLVGRVQRFAADVNVNVEQVMRCRSQGGFYRYNLRSLPAYAADPPRSSLRDAQGYRGDFPDARSGGSALCNLHACCSTESDEQARRKIAADPTSPEWFRTDSQKELFGRYLEEGDLQSAWMSLNSHGWQYSQAKTALMSLADRASDPQLSVIAAAWCARPHERFGSY